MYARVFISTKTADFSGSNKSLKSIIQGPFNFSPSPFKQMRYSIYVKENTFKIFDDIFGIFEISQDRYYSFGGLTNTYAKDFNSFEGQIYTFCFIDFFKSNENSHYEKGPKI